MLLTIFTLLHALRLTLASSRHSFAVPSSSGLSDVIPNLLNLNGHRRTEPSNSDAAFHSRGAKRNALWLDHSGGAESISAEQENESLTFWDEMIERGRCPSASLVSERAAGCFESRSVVLTTPEIEDVKPAREFSRSKGILYVSPHDIYPSLTRHAFQRMQEICNRQSVPVNFWFLLFRAALWMLKAQHVFLYHPNTDRGYDAARVVANAFQQRGSTAVYSVVGPLMDRYDIRLLLEDSSMWLKYIENKISPSAEELVKLSAIGTAQFEKVVIVAPGAYYQAAKAFATERKYPIIRLHDAFPHSAEYAGVLHDIWKKEEDVLYHGVQYRLFKAMLLSINAEEVYICRPPTRGGERLLQLAITRFSTAGLNEVSVVDSVSSNRLFRELYHIRRPEPRTANRQSR